MKVTRKDKIDLIADQALELDRLQAENTKLRRMYAKECSEVRVLRTQNHRLREWFTRSYGESKTSKIVRGIR